MMSKSFRETLNEQMKDPVFKAEWDNLEPEYQVIRTMIEARKARNITQKELLFYQQKKI